jgi:SAM-dependent methyltransferase
MVILPLIMTPRARAKTLNKEEILEKIKKVKWWHSIRLGPVVTQGAVSPEFEKWKAQAIPRNLEGKSVLDIDAADGYYSFLCEQRGAEKVIAIDVIQSWKEGRRNIRSLEGFSTAKKILNSKVGYILMDLYDLDALNTNFDVVLFLGVYYHLRHPFYAIEKIYKKTKKLLVFEGEVLEYGFSKFLSFINKVQHYMGLNLKFFKNICNSLSYSNASIMKIYMRGEYKPPFSTTYSVATIPCIIKMLTMVGFKEVTLIDRFGSRALFVAKK